MSPPPSPKNAELEAKAGKKKARKKSTKRAAEPSSAPQAATPSAQPATQPATQLASSGDVSAFFSRAQIIAQYLKDLSFESPNAPQIFSPAQGQEQGQAQGQAQSKVPHFSLDINVKPQRLAPLRHEVTLVLKVVMQRERDVCFLVEIVYAGLVAVPEDAEDHPLLQALLLIEVPRLLFPYVRNILSELTQSSGFPPLVVQPVDFAALYRKHLADAARQQS